MPSSTEQWKFKFNLKIIWWRQPALLGQQEKWIRWYLLQRELEGVESSRWSKNADFVGNCLVPCIKYPRLPDQHYKTCWILQFHQDKMQNNISNNSPVFMRMSFCTVLSLAEIFSNTWCGIKTLNRHTCSSNYWNEMFIRNRRGKPNYLITRFGRTTFLILVS